MMRRNGFSLPLFVFCGLLAAGLFLVAANGRGHLAAGGPTALGSSPSLCKKPSFTSTQPRGLFGLGRAAQTPRRTVRRFAVDVQPVVEAQPDQKSVWVDRHSQTKMIATVGPSTRNEEMIEAMWQGGADVFRVPMCYSSHEDAREGINLIRKIEARHGSTIGVLMDLQGPKLRIGEFKDGSVAVEEGQRFVLDLKEEVGDNTRVSFPYAKVFPYMTPGSVIPLGGGRVNARVMATSMEETVLEIVRGGRLSTNDRVNIPKVHLPYRALTDQDVKDIEFGLEMGVDWIALSCVRTKEDVIEAKRLVGNNAFIMAKIETSVDAGELSEIIKEADAVMVARGDLGVDTNVESVPPMQKAIIAECKQKGTPVVVSTQMLDSMIFAPTPTRAEASDVANAIYDGADALMLSAETASGSYPLEAVDTMEDIIKAVEQSDEYKKRMDSDVSRYPPNENYALVTAARQIARDVSASAIVCFSSYGRIPRQVARERTTQPVLTLSEDVKTARMLNLVWGVYPVHVPGLSYEEFSFDEVLGKAKETSLEQGLAKQGDMVVVLASKPGADEVPGANIMQIVQA
uniref:Pyruvate kinase n=1 Tax=Lotharella globosa TaxID=91324 RepID=A0A7S3YPY4_9EUKA|mmetsp:Transcript_14269/g.28784  ORF Transcript_14269/g.28784 Transcript_14269/m.28784 type:complete len:572 (-) Transcript_14269:65-1780(-)